MDTKQSLEMQAKGEACPQCHNLSSKPSNRLVQDTCGHTKCRSCLLADDDYCQQCVSSLESNQVDVNGSNDHVTSTEVTDNHTAVICNGNTQQVNHEQTNEIYDETNLNGLVDLETNKTVLEDNEESKTSGSVVTPVREENEPKKSGSIVIPVHIRIQKDPVCYLCTICNKTFTTKGHIKYHQYCNGDLKPFKCETCDKEFVLKVQYQVHQWKHNNIKPFKCQICQKSFREKSKLSRHMTALHSSGKDYVCPHCGKCFKIKDSLRIHSLIHKNERPFACNICPATFNNSSNLKKHVATHSNFPGEKAHMCDQCGRRFKLKWALSVHRRSHSNIRPHACNICPKTFVNLKDLQRHLLIHSDVKQFTCGICMTMFRRKDILRRHMKNTHPGPPEPSSTDQSSSRLKRQLLRAITILREAATSYQMLNLRRIYH
ncbi:hypothetical protein ABEB36_012459 [Hypothenemus hampei]|uniref:Uncharacterized protein n=1 Tax=Hypothenemus hampei TaxID=57062 RepID=A0ABD1EDA7_HYPHA